MGVWFFVASMITHEIIIAYITVDVNAFDNKM